MGLIQYLMIKLDAAAKAKLEEDMRKAGKGGAEGAADEVRKTQPLFDRAWGSIKAGLAGLAAGMAAAFSVRVIVAFAAELYKLGANAGETASKFTTTFGTATDRASAFLAGFANKAGLSTVAAQDLLATIGAMVQGMGAAKPQSEALAEGILKLAGDLTSFHNVPIEETFAALRSGLVGEYEPLRRFGIVLTAADVQQRALIMTGKSHVEQLTALEKSQAAFALASERAGVAVGDLDRTQDSQVNTMRRVNAEWIDFKTFLGVAISGGVEGAGVFKALGDVIKGLKVWVEENKDAIRDWVETGIKFMIEGVKAVWPTLQEFGHILGFLADVVSETTAGIAHDWLILQSRFAAAGQEIIGVLIKIEEGALKAAQLLHLNGVADAIQKELGRATKTWNDLGLTVKTTAREAAESLGSKDTGATRTDSMGGALAANVGAGSDKAKTSLTDMANTGKTKVKELSEAVKGHMKDMSDAYASAGRAFSGEHVGAILRGRDATVAAYKEMQKQAEMSSEDMAAAAKNVELAYVGGTVPAMLQGSQKIQEELHRERDSLQALSDEVHAGRAAYTDDYVPAVLRGSRDIDDAMHQTAMAQTGVNEIFRGGEQYYTNTVVPSILKGQGAQQAAIHKTQQDTETAAKSGSDKWIDAMNLMVNATNSLGRIVGGVMGGIINTFGQISNGVAGIAGAVRTVEGASGGLLGTLSKVAGVLGGIGSAASVIGGVLDLGGQILGGLGITHPDKNPERLATNERLYQAARSGDRNAIDQLYRMSGRANAQEGWATDLARSDAWDKLNRALTENRNEWSQPGNPMNDYWNLVIHGSQVSLRKEMGGLLAKAGLYYGHAGEGVLTAAAMGRMGTNWLEQANNAARQGTVMPAPSNQSTDNRSLSVEVNLYGVQDREIPQRVVDAIKTSIGKDYQDKAALAGNVRMS